MKKAITTALKVTISLGLLIFLLTKPEIHQSWELFLKARLDLLVLAFAIYFLAIFTNIYKWQLLLKSAGMDVPFGNLTGYFFTGLFFGNFLLPMVAGDVMRGYGLAVDSEQAAEAAISVLVDRLVGLASFLFGGLLGVAFALWGLGRRDFSSLALVVLAANILFLLGFASLLSRRLRKLLERIVGGNAVFLRLSSAVNVYREKPAALGKAFLVAILGLYLTSLVNWCASEAVHAGISPIYIFILNPLTPFAPLLIPSVGGLGVNQGTFVFLYNNVAGVASPAGAFSLSLVMQAIIYITSLPGAFLWWRQKRNKEGEHGERKGTRAEAEESPQAETKEAKG